MIIQIISYLLIAWSFFQAWKMFNVEPQLIQKVYFQNLKDWMFAILLVSSVISILFLISSFDIPEFLKFSWLKLIGANSTNLIIAPVGTQTTSVISIVATIILYCCFVFFLPYLAKLEEMQFRYYVFSRKERIINSIKFGFLHMVVGVPVFAAIILSILGYIFSLKYMSTYKKYYQEFEFSEVNDLALDSSTSLHAKYNFILITLIFLLITLNNLNHV